MSAAAVCVRRQCRAQPSSAYCSWRLAAALLVALALAAAVPRADAAQPASEAAATREGAASVAERVAALSSSSGGSGSPKSSSGSGPSTHQTFPLIIVFREASTLARLRVMCNSSPLIYRLFARGLSLGPDCYMPGICRRIYSKTVPGASQAWGLTWWWARRQRRLPVPIRLRSCQPASSHPAPPPPPPPTPAGFSGDFTDADLARLERCLPASIFYREPDGQVGAWGWAEGMQGAF